MTFSFGQSQNERIQIDILGYERPQEGEYFDDNWLVAQIQVSAADFRGRVDVSIQTAELTEFLAQLRPLHATLAGTAEFTTMEDQLELHLSGDGRGLVELTGRLSDAPGGANQLHFKLRFDQTQLGASIQESENVISAYPIRT